MLRFVPLAVLLTAGCSATITLFPVSGPLTEQKPRPVLEATAHGVTGNHGDIETAMPDGGQCRGKWTSMASGPKVNGLLWVHGQVAGVSIAPGNRYNYGEAIMTCASGALLELEFYTIPGTADGMGVGKDSAGNIYKALF
jgi:hypothetical protein